jgi:hypothetical protein
MQTLSIKEVSRQKLIRIQFPDDYNIKIKKFLIGLFFTDVINIRFSISINYHENFNF